MLNHVVGGKRDDISQKYRQGKRNDLDPNFLSNDTKVDTLKENADALQGR